MYILEKESLFNVGKIVQILTLFVIDIKYN